MPIIVVAETRVQAGGVITVDNRSAHSVKAVAPGGSAIIEPASEPAKISFESAAPVGLTLQIWWIARPREICRIFVPWDRTVVVTGDQLINCLSYD
jgi:hypothetical protein